VTQTTGIIVARTAITIEAANRVATNVDMTAAIKTIVATIILVAKRKQEKVLQEER
jgi:hypothetical protein